MAKANVFVLIEASSVCEGERRLGYVFIGTNVWWAESEFLLLCHFFISLVIVFMLRGNIHLLVLVKSLYR